jgi:hypothetical protein
MRVIAALAVLTATLSFSIGEAKAEPYWPWCARYGWSTICAYATLQQCQAGVSGAGGYCLQNVMPPPIVSQRVSRVRKHRHRY